MYQGWEIPKTSEDNDILHNAAAVIAVSSVLLISIQ